MSLVLACAFPDMSIILSDSRVSSGINKQDVLQKVYQIGPYLAVGFTSNDVILTERIISVMTDYVKNHAKSKNTRYLLGKLPKVSKYYYEKFTNRKKKPEMDFVFAGIDKTVSAVVSGKALFNLLTRGLDGQSGTLSPRFIWGMERQKGDSVPLPPPASIIAIQHFPQGIFEQAAGLGHVASGSDIKASDKIRGSFEKAIVYAGEEIAIRQAMIASIIEDHRREQDVETIGGMTQTVLIDEQGVKPLGYSYTKINNDGSEGDKISMSFENGVWIQKRSRDGKETIVSKCPLIISTNEIFEASLVIN